MVVVGGLGRGGLGGLGLGGKGLGLSAWGPVGSQLGLVGEAWEEA